MRRLASVLSLALLLAACGNNPHSAIDGTWTVYGTGGSNGTNGFHFSFTLTSTSNNGLSVTNFSVIALPGQCLLVPPTFSGTFNAATDTFQLTISSRSQLRLNGTLNNNTITGTWTMTSVYIGCNGSGTLTMTKQ